MIETCVIAYQFVVLVLVLVVVVVAVIVIVSESTVLIHSDDIHDKYHTSLRQYKSIGPLIYDTVIYHSIILFVLTSCGFIGRSFWWCHHERKDSGISLGGVFAADVTVEAVCYKQRQ